MAFDIRGLDTGMTWHNQHFRLEGFKFFHKENVLNVNIYEFKFWWKIFAKYSGCRLMGSLSDWEKLIPIADPY